MAFGIGINTQGADVGPDKRIHEQIACDCWFTATGRTIPRMIKYEDEDGAVQILRDIEILHSERKNFCGIPAIEYECRVEIEDREYFPTLVFYPDSCTWKLVRTTETASV